MKVLIIGGTGTISTAVADRLNDVGADVTVFNRGLRPIRNKQPVNVIVGDKNDRAAFVDKMKTERFDAVIDMISYNPNDAQTTLEAFGVHTHFVFTSTVAVYKRPFRGAAITEGFARWDNDSFPYGYHKARMEDYLNEQAAQGRKITVIRPSLTYGIGGKNIGVLRNNYGIIKRIQENKPIIVFGDGTNPFDFTFAPDIALAYAGVLCRETSYGQTYHATSGDVRIWDDLYLEFGKIVGIEPKLLHISTEMLMNASPERFNHVYQEKMYAGIYDNTKIKTDVPEYVPQYTLDKTLRAMYDWYMSDEAARVVDEDTENFEDYLADKYRQMIELL